MKPPQNVIMATCPHCGDMGPHWRAMNKRGYWYCNECNVAFDPETKDFGPDE